jgi:putative endonuclease
MNGRTNQDNHRYQLGIAGENFVAQLLQGSGWQILGTRWHCRWGEIDIIARDAEWLIFVEVKTRQGHHPLSSLDAQGRLAVDYRKQQKLGLAAQCFLVEFPEQFPEHKLPLHHRFDVALVGYMPQTSLSLTNSPTKPPMPYDNLHLVEYLPHAFELV